MPVDAAARIDDELAADAGGVATDARARANMDVSADGRDVALHHRAGLQVDSTHDCGDLERPCPPRMTTLGPVGWLTVTRLPSFVAESIDWARIAFIASSTGASRKCAVTSWPPPIPGASTSDQPAASASRFKAWSTGVPSNW